MDMTSANPVRDRLMKENPTFRDLIQQHELCEKRLDELSNLTYPNDDELVEETTLKKRKLAIKDEIYSMMREGSVPTEH